MTVRCISGVLNRQAENERIKKRTNAGLRFYFVIQPLFNQVDPVEMENQHRQQQIAAKTIDKRHRQKPFYPVCKYIS